MSARRQGADRKSGGQIDPIGMRVNPLVPELAGKTARHDGLKSKFRVSAATAVALVQGAGGEHQFSDAATTDKSAVVRRGHVRPQTDFGQNGADRYRSSLEVRLGPEKSTRTAKAVPIGQGLMPISRIGSWDHRMIF
jgi:hypothetical protein